MTTEVMKPDTKVLDLCKALAVVALLVVVAFYLSQAQKAPEAGQVPPEEQAAPVMSTPAVDASGSTSLSGTGQPGSTVELWDGDVKLGSVEVGADGTWEFRGELEPGQASLVARTVDAEGNVLEESEPLAVSVPETAATAGAAEAAPGEGSTAELQPPVVDDQGGFSLSGTGQPGSMIEVWNGDVQVGTAEVGADGTWELSGELGPVEASLVARTVDDEGNVLDESEPLAVSVPETSVPAGAAEAAPGEGATAALQPPEVDARGGFTLSGTGQAGSMVEIWDGEAKLGAAKVGADGTWEFSGELEPGEAALVARTVDAGGNVLEESEPLAISVPVPSEPEAPTLGEPQVDEAGAVTLSGTGEPGTTIEVLEDDSVLGTAVVSPDGSWTLSYQVSAGDQAKPAQGQGQPASSGTGLTVRVASGEGGTGKGKAASPVPAGHVYIVKEGDYLIKIAKKFWGDGDKYRLIVRATNAKAAVDPRFRKIKHARLINPGQRLWIPDLP
jgi:nucleoid-associated protein YgaU